MVLIIYYAWFLCQVHLLIVLLNFLIAVISETYVTVIQNEPVKVKYSSRCYVNKEASYLCKFLKMHTQPMEIMILSISKARLDLEETEIESFMSTLKTLIEGEISSIKQLVGAQNF